MDSTRVISISFKIHHSYWCYRRITSMGLQTIYLHNTLNVTQQWYKKIIDLILMWQCSTLSFQEQNTVCFINNSTQFNHHIQIINPPFNSPMQKPPKFCESQKLCLIQLVKPNAQDEEDRTQVKGGLTRLTGRIDWEVKNLSAYRKVQNHSQTQKRSRSSRLNMSEPSNIRSDPIAQIEDVCNGV